MYGNTLTRSLEAVGQMLRRPHHGARWVADRLSRQSPIEQGMPWTSWTSIDFLRTHVKPGMRVFEWGGGGSTLFWAKLGCRVTCCESNEYWKDQIGERLRRSHPELAGSIELRFVPAETGTPEAVQAYIDSARAGAPWDVILVDGLEETYISRMDCLKITPEVVAPDGVVLLDDAWRPRYDGAATLMKGFERTMFWGLGPARMGCTRTDMYRRRQP
ncbi:MAG: hypothetical protein ACK4WH_04335 [Phycisphaerales bacterium]